MVMEAAGCKWVNIVVEWVKSKIKVLAYDILLATTTIIKHAIGCGKTVS